MEVCNVQNELDKKLTIEQVKYILNQYKYLEGRINTLNAALMQYDTTKHNDIYSASVASGISDMPRGTTVGDKTCDIALSIFNDNTLEMYRREANVLGIVYTQLTTAINSLPERQQFACSMKYAPKNENVSNAKVIEMGGKRFEDYSKRTFWRDLNEAIQNLSEWLKIPKYVYDMI